MITCSIPIGSWTVKYNWPRKKARLFVSELLPLYDGKYSTYSLDLGQWKSRLCWSEYFQWLEMKSLDRIVIAGRLTHLLRAISALSEAKIWGRKLWGRAWVSKKCLSESVISSGMSKFWPSQIMIPVGDEFMICKRREQKWPRNNNSQWRGFRLLQGLFVFAVITCSGPSYPVYPEEKKVKRVQMMIWLTCLLMDKVRLVTEMCLSMWSNEAINATKADFNLYV